MKVVYVKERKPWGYTLSMAEVGRGSIAPVVCDTLVITGDETQEARLLGSAIKQFQGIASVAGITRELKERCEKLGVAIGPGWRVYSFPS